MSRRVAVGLAVILVGSATGCDERSLVPESSGEERTARVLRAIDGDTLLVATEAGQSETVRLVGIDAPESVKPGSPVECGGPRAAEALARFEGSEVRLVIDRSQGERDRYGRLLAYARTAGGEDLGRSQIAAGWAEVYVHGGVPFERSGRYRRAEGKAERWRRGAWGGCGGRFHQAR